MKDLTKLTVIQLRDRVKDICKIYQIKTNFTSLNKLALETIIQKYDKYKYEDYDHTKTVLTGHIAFIRNRTPNPRLRVKAITELAESMGFTLETRDRQRRDREGRMYRLYFAGSLIRKFGTLEETNGYLSTFIRSQRNWEYDVYREDLQPITRNRGWSRSALITVCENVVTCPDATNEWLEKNQGVSWNIQEFLDYHKVNWVRS